MARIGYKYVGTPGATQGTDLQTALAANLTTWTVGALYTFGTGTTERNYFVLSQGVAEILVYCPHGNASDTTNGILASYIEPNTLLGASTDHPLAFAYSPTGGYAASLVATYDPATDALFWPTASSKMHAMDSWYEGQPSQDVYFIEDDVRAELTVYCGKTTTNTGYSMVAMGGDIQVAVGTSGYGTGALLYFGITVGTGSPRPARVVSVTWNSSVQPQSYYGAYLAGGGGGISLGNLVAFTGTTQPLAGNYLGREIPLRGADLVFVGVIRQELLLEVGRMTATYGTIRGSVDQRYVHLFQDYFTPWAENLVAPPTVA